MLLYEKVQVKLFFSVMKVQRSKDGPRQLHAAVKRAVGRADPPTVETH